LGQDRVDSLPIICWRNKKRLESRVKPLGMVCAVSFPAQDHPPLERKKIAQTALHRTKNDSRRRS